MLSLALAITDMFVCFFTPALWFIFTPIDLHDSDIACIAIYFVSAVSLLQSMMISTAIAHDRYLLVCLPHRAPSDDSASDDDDDDVPRDIAHYRDTGVVLEQDHGLRSRCLPMSSSVRVCRTLLEKDNDRDCGGLWNA